MEAGGNTHTIAHVRIVAKIVRCRESVSRAERRLVFFQSLLYLSLIVSSSTAVGTPQMQYFLALPVR